MSSDIISQIVLDPRRPKAIQYAEQHTVGEKYWAQLQGWLEEKGYKLRPRFQPNWVPSWPKTEEDFRRHEDGQVHHVRKFLSYSRSRLSDTLLQSPVTIDAIRISDGAAVMLKSVSRMSQPHELGIARYLGSVELTSDPRNHCVPVYEVLPVPAELQFVGEGENGEDIIVMPLLRTFDSPPFETMGEAVEYFTQIFEVSLAYTCTCRIL